MTSRSTRSETRHIVTTFKGETRAEWFSTHADAFAGSLSSVRIESNALALEYERLYGHARGDLNIADLVNNPAGGGVGRVFGPGFEEEIGCFLGGDGRVLHENVRDAALVRLDAI